MSNSLDIRVPDEAIPYILFQRTEYLSHNVLFQVLTMMGLIPFLYKFSVRLKTAFFKRQIISAYVQDMQTEYNSIQYALPEHAERILDVGCGIAGIDVLLSRHYGSPDIYLLDKTGIDRVVYYGFNDRGSVYNALSTSKDLLVLNGISSNNIHLQEATDQNSIESGDSFDLVLSLISWGYHYPVATYLSQVYGKLKQGGHLIIDIRNGTDGEKEIAALFSSVSVILATDSYQRILAVK